MNDEYVMPSYVEKEFQTFVNALFKGGKQPSSTALTILRKTFFAGAQSIYIGLHESDGLPKTDFIDQIGDEIGTFVLEVIQKHE